MSNNEELNLDVSEEHVSDEELDLDVVEDPPRHSEEFQRAAETPPRPAQPNRGPHKSSTQIAAEVWAGKWGDDDWHSKVEAAGYNADLIDDLVSRGVGRRGRPDEDRPSGRS